MSSKKKYVMVSIMSDIEQRKVEHLEVVLGGKAQSRGPTTGFECLDFEHCALPEINFVDVNISTTFLKRRLSAPLLISSMTGGPAVSERLNQTIAEACAELGIAFGVGSQRIALEGGKALGFDRSLRARAPNAVILANFGAAQLLEWDGVDMARRAVDMIEADGLIVHLNPLQEVLQPGGDVNWAGLLARIGDVCRQSSFPVICKEVGSGISARTARQLVDAGVKAIDVAGVGGTSWAAVEAERATTPQERQLADAFRHWGIPTAEAVHAVRQACPEIALIASGGVRDGIECAKAIRLGADLAALAGHVLAPAVEGPVALIAALDTVIEQLRVACFCTGSRDLAALSRAPLRMTPSFCE